MKMMKMKKKKEEKKMKMKREKIEEKKKWIRKKIKVQAESSRVFDVALL